jgi:hypothetical protein
MGSKIQSFQTTFRTGVARPNLFDVAFTRVPGAILSDNKRLIEDEMSLRVQSVTMPGKNITTTPNDNAYGPSYEMANGISYAEDIEVTYILDQDHRVREFFNSWQDVVVNPSTFDLNYYKDYIGTMEIYQVDQNERNCSGIRLEEVYPKSVGPITYSMESGNSFQTVTVNMAFKRWVPLIIAFQPTKGSDVTWLGNPSHNTAPYELAASISKVYEITQKFGLSLPGGVESALGRVQAITQHASDPLTFLKRKIAHEISIP